MNQGMTLMIRSFKINMAEIPLFGLYNRGGNIAKTNTIRNKVSYLFFLMFKGMFKPYGITKRNNALIPYYR